MIGKYSRRQFLFRGSAAFAIGVSLKACTGTTDSVTSNSATQSSTSPRADAAPIRFILDWALQGTHAPLVVAIEKGYFAEEGLDVSFDRGTGSADSIAKVASDAFDLGFGDINSLIEFNAKNPDRQVKAVAMFYNKSPMAIMALQETGISDPKMLEGKRLGIPAGSATRRLVPLFAKTVGFDVGKVEIPAIDSKLQQTLLLTKEIDAIAPYTTSALPNLQSEGYGPDRLNIFRFVDYGLDLYGNAVLVPVSFLEENPNQVKAFLRAFTKGFQDTLADPDTAIAMMTSYDDLFDQDLERQRLQIAIDTLFVTPEVEVNGFGMVDAERFEQTIAQVVEGFGLASTPEADEVFDGSFLPTREARDITVALRSLNQSAI
jgi:NitT/TauT family transport system substrate-binding protein